jgi:hypothetical protein
VEDAVGVGTGVSVLSQFSIHTDACHAFGILFVEERPHDRPRFSSFGHVVPVVEVFCREDVRLSEEEYSVCYHLLVGVRIVGEDCHKLALFESEEE